MGRLRLHILCLLALQIGVIANVPPPASATTALRFDGFDDYCEIAPDPTLDIRNEITLEAWIYWEEELGLVAYQMILNKDSIAYEISIGDLQVPGRFLWFIGGINTAAPDVSGGWRDGGPIPRNEWVHVAVSYDGSTVKSYINGQITGNHVSSGLIRLQPSNPVRIGSRDPFAASTSAFHGTIDELRIWNVGRTQDQIQRFMTERLTGYETGLVAFFDFNEGEGQVARDKTRAPLLLNHARLGRFPVTDLSDPTWVPSEIDAQLTPSSIENWMLYE